jgi:hypothetical protein
MPIVADAKYRIKLGILSGNSENNIQFNNDDPGFNRKT